jgi:hypothetical protein
MFIEALEACQKIYIATSVAPQDHKTVDISFCTCTDGIQIQERKKKMIPARSGGDRFTFEKVTNSWRRLVR